MPTYEYACTSCGNEWEAEQSIKEAPLTECPRCHEQTARRQISRGTGFILKGGGWYSDLYATPAKKSDTGGDKGSSGSGGDSGGSSSSGSSTPSTPSTPSSSTAAAA
jgi:putative FmdB family regulatory protein